MTFHYASTHYGHFITATIHEYDNSRDAVIKFYIEIPSIKDVTPPTKEYFFKNITKNKANFLMCSTLILTPFSRDCKEIHANPCRPRIILGEYLNRLVY